MLTSKRVQSQSTKILYKIFTCSIDLFLSATLRAKPSSPSSPPSFSSFHQIYQTAPLSFPLATPPSNEPSPRALPPPSATRLRRRARVRPEFRRPRSETRRVGPGEREATECHHVEPPLHAPHEAQAAPRPRGRNALRLLHLYPIHAHLFR